MDNPKVTVKETGKFGKGVFAHEKILKGEVIAEFDGEIYGWDDERWSQELYDHVVQFEEKKWRDSKGIARWINHSCNPNCGIKELFKVTAMRDIEPGEEITWDYEMTEKHPWWRMKCECGSTLCRKEIGNFDAMPQNIRERYRGYISEWLLK
ncbi:MAG: SET domain-containing protein [Patescibacteria group bacterium]